MGSHFHRRREWEIVQPRPYRVTAKADWAVAVAYLAMGRGSRQSWAAASFAARSSPAIDPFSFLAAAFDRGSIRFATVGFVIAVARFFLAGPDPVAAVAVVAGPAAAADSAAIVSVAGPGFAVVADLVCFSGSVSFAAETAKGKAAVAVIFCSLTRRSFV